MRRVLSTVVVLFAATILRGKPLYVAPSGDDTLGNGTLEAPFASLGAAAAIAAPGDTVYLRGGVYRLDKGLRIGGLTDVAFVAYPGEEPILSGSVPLGKWRRVTDRKILAKVGAAAAKRLYVTDLAKAGIDEGKKVQDWTDDEQNTLRTIINDEYKVEGALRSEVQMNIKCLMDIGCYRGIRHRLGLPLRGQSTKNNARTRKGKKKTIANKKKATK